MEQGGTLSRPKGVWLEVEHFVKTLFEMGWIRKAESDIMVLKGVMVSSLSGGQVKEMPDVDTNELKRHYCLQLVGGTILSPVRVFILDVFTWFIAHC